MNSELPIAAFRAEILGAVKNNQVVIIQAETGAGKSTQVPQFLLDARYEIVVTEPRRLAARTVSERAAKEYGTELGYTIGYRTANERKDSPNTRCLFCTDGLALIRELMRLGKHDILVLDEVHEWNLNLEVLVAWVKLSLSLGAKFKVVLMSATVEAEKLSAYFSGAPVITVPGRLFPVEERLPRGLTIEDEALSYLREGHNVLLFQPGKKEIAESIAKLKASGINAELIALHGDLQPDEQGRAFGHYNRPKCIVSTNVAQTSITIDDITVVIDSGLGKYNEVVNGVEGLYERPISKADSLQRKGRAGRCRAGIYVDWHPSVNRDEFPKPEILRTRLDQTVLRLAEAGFDMEELTFFHQPDKTAIREAKIALIALGCIDSSGKVTEIGNKVSRLPVSVPFARMIVEADRFRVVDDVITIAAILEQGGITTRSKSQYEEPAWKRLALGEESSDLMAQLAVWKAANRMSKTQMHENGIFAKGYFQALDKRRLIADALRGKVHAFESTGDRDKILKAVCAGMVNHLYRGNYGQWINGDVTRELARESVVNTFGVNWIVGIPFDLEIPTRFGKRTLNLVQMATVVKPAWFVEIAPQLVKVVSGINPYYDPQSDVCMSTSQTVFNGQKIAEVNEATPDHPDAPRLFAQWLAGKML